MTFRLPHLLAAVVLHVVLLGLMVGGVQCSGKVQRPPVISAVLLDPSRQQVAQDKRREEQRRQEQRRKAEQERKRREDEARRVEQQRKAQADAAAKNKKEDDARKARLATDQKKAADQKKATEQKAAEQKKAQQQKAEDAARRERETQAREETAARARMAEALEAEETQRTADREAAARAASERDARLAEWADVLVRHVSRNWVRPPSASGDFECVVRMQLLPDGTVTNAKIERSCGSAQLDRSVEDAVYRASPLPKPSDPSVFDRDLTIRFVPES